MFNKMIVNMNIIYLIIIKICVNYVDKLLLIMINNINHKVIKNVILINIIILNLN